MIAPVQTSPLAAKAAQNTSAETATFAASVTVGNLIVVFVIGYGTGVTFTVTDGLANTYSQAGAYAYSGSYVCSIFYSVVTTGGSCTISATPGSSAYVTLVAAEYSGVQASPLDHVTSSSGTSATFTAGSLTVSGAGELAAACFVPAASNGNAVSGVGLLRLVAVNDVCATTIPLIACDGIAGTTFMPTVIFSSSLAFAGVAASFKPTSSGGGSGGVSRARVVNGF